MSHLGRAVRGPIVGLLAVSATALAFTCHAEGASDEAPIKIVEGPGAPNATPEPARADLSGIPVPPVPKPTIYGPEGNALLTEIQGMSRTFGALDQSSQVRMETLKGEAFSYGLRAGLHWRYGVIEESLATRSPYLDQVFNFYPLMIEGQWVPPVVGRFEDYFEIEDETKASAVRVAYRMDSGPKVVGNPPNWRGFLVRRYPKPTPPADAILPVNKAEAATWARASADGWAKGVAQADILFEAHTALLVNTIQGMVNYRVLVAQGVMEPVSVRVREGGIRVEPDFINIGEVIYETVAPATFKPFPEWSQSIPDPAKETAVRGQNP